MAVKFDDKRLFCIEAPLSLASNDETRLFKQFSKDFGAFSCVDAGYYSQSMHRRVKWRTRAIAPYKSVFSDYKYKTRNEKGSKMPHHHHIFATNTYGRWWEKGLTGQTDVTLSNDMDAVVHDFVEFIFHEEVYPLWVSVTELCNPGGVIRIWAKDSDNQWHKLWSGLPQRLPNKERIFSPQLKSCNFKTKILRVEFHCTHLDYCSYVSGVFLIGTSEFVVPRNEFENQNLGFSLEAVGGPKPDPNDPSNLTPNLRGCKLNDVVLQLERVFCEKYVSYNRYLQSSQTVCENTMQPMDNKLLGTHKIDTVVSPGGCTSGNSTYQNFDCLSDEMLLNVLKYLDTKSLFLCTQLNRRFHRVTQDLTLGTNLNLKFYGHSLNDTVVNTLTLRCRNLRCLDLSWCGSNNTITPKVFNTFLHACGSLLIDLRLDHCYFVEDSVVEKISLICINLKELCLSETKATTDGLRSLKKFETLERLDLSGTLINDSTLRSIIQRNPLIRVLNLSKLRMVDMITMAPIISYSCPKLEIFCCQYTSLTSGGIGALARCTRLREFDIAYGCIDNFGYEPLFEFYSSLEKIVLTGCKRVSYSQLESLLACPIQQLHVRGVNFLTETMCLRFLSSCPDMKVIDISGCCCINESDVKNWRMLYPQVCFKWSDNNMYRTRD